MYPVELLKKATNYYAAGTMPGTSVRVDLKYIDSTHINFKCYSNCSCGIIYGIK